MKTFFKGASVFMLNIDSNKNSQISNKISEFGNSNYVSDNTSTGFLSTKGNRNNNNNLNKNYFGTTNKSFYCARNSSNYNNNSNKINNTLKGKNNDNNYKNYLVF